MPGSSHKEFEMLWPHETRAALDGCGKKKMPIMKNVTMGLSHKTKVHISSLSKGDLAKMSDNNPIPQK